MKFSSRRFACCNVTRDPYRRSLTLDCTTRFNNVVVASFVYTFDAHSRPAARNNDRFAYNDRDEIIGATIGTNHIEHAYDTIGNHVFLAYNAVTNFYANNQLNQTTASYACVPSIDSGGNDAQPQFGGYDILSANKFTWLAQGGLQRDGRFIYAFDAEDQLVSVTSSTLSNGAIRVVNAYDYRHRRISKTVYTMRDDSPPTSPLAPPLPIAHRSWHLQERHDFVYDNWNLIHETVTTVDANSATNVAEIEYFWGPDLSNTLQGAGGVGGLLAVSQNGQFYFPVYDNNGNIVKYLDENGNIVAVYTYDDFGQTIEETDPMIYTFSFRFSTKYYEDDIFLCYYGHRFYSPILRIWLNCDPVGNEGGVNLTSFCKNMPMGGMDFLGLTVVYDDKMFPFAIIFDLFYELEANTLWWHPYNRSSYPEGTFPMKDVISPKKFPWWRRFDDNADVVIRLKREKKEDFEKIMKDAFCYACSRVKLHDLFWDKYLDEMIFDTPYQKSWDRYFVIEGEKNVWRGNEINYAGIVIYEAMAGMSKSTTFVYAWKSYHGYSVSKGTLYWYEKGFELFEKYKKIPDICASKGKKGNGK